jgi:hypothetical protein
VFEYGICNDQIDAVIWDGYSAVRVKDMRFVHVWILQYDRVWIGADDAGTAASKIYQLFQMTRRGFDLLAASGSKIQDHVIWSQQIRYDRIEQEPAICSVNLRESAFRIQRLQNRSAALFGGSATTFKIKHANSNPSDAAHTIVVDRIR